MAVTISNNSVKISSLSFIYVLLVAVSSFSLLYGWVPVLHKFLYLCVIGCMLSALLVPKYYISNIAIFTYLYFAVVILNAVMGDAYAFDIRFLDAAIMLFSTSCCFYLLKSGDDSMKKWVLILVSLILILQTMASVPIYMAGGDTIRELITMQHKDENAFDWDYLYRMGIVNYDMIHALPTMVPPIIMWLRKKDLKKSWFFFLLISLVGVLTLAFVYESTTVQLLAFLGLVASLLIHKTNKKRSNQRIIILLVLITPFLISDALQEGVLKTVENASWGEISKKAGAIRYDIQHKSQSSDVATRSELYGQSLNEFFSSPIWGTNNSDDLGGHSAIFDRMGAFGLIGFVSYILVVILIIRFINRSLPPNVNQWYYYLSVISFVTVILLKNMHTLEVWLMFCVFAPSVLSLSENVMLNKKAKPHKQINLSAK